MGLRKVLKTIGEWKIPIVIALSVAGYYTCGKAKISEYVEKPISKSHLEERLSGTPLSVEMIGDAHRAGFSTVIETKEGKYVLCNASRTRREVGYTVLTEVAALIESEINDGDSESIDVKGCWVGDKFKINSVSANGYSLDLR